MNDVVVGVDGSDCGAAALEQAAAEADLRGVPLHVISAWEIPVAAYGGGVAPLGPESFDIFEQNAKAVVDAAVAAAKRLRPGLEVKGQVVQGQPAAALVEAGKDAAMIVVGNRGRGGFKSLVLGSVSHQVVLHATSPVLVVHGGGEGETAAA